MPKGRSGRSCQFFSDRHLDRFSLRCSIGTSLPSGCFILLFSFWFFPLLATSFGKVLGGRSPFGGGGGGSHPLWAGDSSFAPSFPPQFPPAPFSGLWSMERHWGFFKRCVQSGGKLTPADCHSSCLFCLGEAHGADSCLHCQAFSGQARKIQVAWLRTALKEAAFGAGASSLTSGQLVPETAPTSKVSTPTLTLTMALMLTTSAKVMAPSSGLMPEHTPSAKASVSPAKKKRDGGETHKS